MSITIVQGNIWDTQCKVLVNAVNCEGVMGAGMALEAKQRFPEMFLSYKHACDQKLLTVGKLQLYTKSSPYWILNFPTKDKWRLPAKEEYIAKGLEKFVATYQEKGITSIAFPMLGCGKGGLTPSVVLQMMKDYLSSLPIRIEIYQPL